jgi:hypothetical protein
MFGPNQRKTAVVRAVACAKDVHARGRLRAFVALDSTWHTGQIKCLKKVRIRRDSRVNPRWPATRCKLGQDFFIGIVMSIANCALPERQKRALL